VKTTFGKADAPAEETIYHYDDKGRLASYAGRGAIGSETTRFEYDEQGRKTRVVTSNVPASPAGPYGGGLPWPIALKVAICTTLSPKVAQ
jgi:hypothetical protein